MLSRVVHELRARHLLADVSSPRFVPHLQGLIDAAAAAASGPASRPPAVYAGFDPTGPSLHLGHLAVLTTLGHLQRAGLRPIALIGGATAMIGDPTGRSVERPMLSRETIAANAASIRRCLEGEGVLSFESVEGEAGLRIPAAECVDNLSFYEGQGVLDFMREIGVHFRVSAMLNKDSVRARLDAEGGGLSFAEFSYQAFQGADFLRLHAAAGCWAQLGGADQWGNITAGVDLVRRVHGGGSGSDAGSVYGLTTPLLTTADGRKFGKSTTEGGGGSTAVWLDPALSSHGALFQYLRNTPDADAPRLLLQLSPLPLEEALEVGRRHAADPGAGLAQTVLAETVVRRLRGQRGLELAQAAARVLFGSGGGGGGHASSAAPAAAAAATAAPPADEAAVLLGLADSGQVPSVSLPAADVIGRSILDVAVAAGIVASKSEARRLVAGRGLSLSLSDRGGGGAGGPVTDPALVVGWAHLSVEAEAGETAGKAVAGETAGSTGRRGVLVLRAGKKRTTLVVVPAPSDATASGAEAQAASGAPPP